MKTIGIRSDSKNGQFVNDDSVGLPKVDALYNPNLDDSECVFMSSTSECFVQCCVLA